MTRGNHLGANILRTASFKVKKSLQQFLAERIASEKKNRSLFVVNGTKGS